MQSRNEKTAETIESILQDMNEGAVSDEFLREEEDLFRCRVIEFANLIADDVRTALTAGSMDEVAREYVDAAVVLLGDSGTGAQEPVAQTDIFSSAALRTAAESMRKEIAEEFRKGNLAPDLAEIEDHTIELAQCVLSNWLALLQKAKRLQADQTVPIALSTEALPRNVFATSSLFEGIDAFALPLDIVEKKFTQFLEEIEQPAMLAQLRSKLLGKPVSRIVSLAPDLVLASPGPQIWYLTGSRSHAERALEFHLSLTLRWALQPIMQASNKEWVISGVRSLAWPTQKPKWDPLLVKQVIELAVKQVNSSMTGARTGNSPVHREGLVVPQHFYRSMEALVEKAIDPAAPSSAAETYRVVRDCVFDIKATLEENAGPMNVPPMEMCQIIIATITGSVAERARIQAGGFAEEDDAAQFMQMSTPEAQEVMQWAAGTARALLDSPSIQSSIDRLTNTQ